MNTAVESDVKDVQERKETKAEAARRKKRAAEQLEGIEPLVNNLWYEAKYQTVPMFVAYFTHNQDDKSKLDPHFANYGLEDFDEQLQKAVLEMLDGHTLLYECVRRRYTWAEVPEALPQYLRNYLLEPTGLMLSCPKSVGTT